ncbi:MAG: SDR family oxidoreductase [Anaerolineaceae bacterium]
MKALVFGASGYIGTNLVPKLLEQGFSVVATARNVGILEARNWAGVELVAADALAPASLAQALQGVDVAFYLVHSMGSGGDFARLDREAAANFRDAAASAGVRRIIYLGGLQPAADASEHLRSRLETGEVLRDGPISVTEVQAGIVVGAGSAGFEVIRDLANHLPIMITPRWVKSRTRPIALEDLLAYLVLLAQKPETAGKTYEVGGPETISYGKMLTTFAAVVGKRSLIVPVPVLTPRLSSYWLGLVTAVPASVARPLIDGLSHDLIPDDRAIRSVAPIQLHSYREAILAALEQERSLAVPARWTEGALVFRGYNPEISYYAKGERTEVQVAAAATSTWKVVSSIGGESGYYFGNVLWQVRGLMDRLAGGPGMRRGRRHPAELRVGDTVDFWRVVSIDPGRRLTLLAEMRLPGTAILEFEVVPFGDRASRLITSARFHPAGVLGLLYWNSLTPMHKQIFRRMPEAMARRAEWLDAVRG